MRFAILLGVCLGFVTTSLLNGASFSETRDLPPLKLAASDLEAILSRTQSLVTAANGLRGKEGFVREAVKIDIDGHEIEIPHFSLASSVAFPGEVFGFSYTYYQPDRPMSAVIIDLGDNARRISVSGQSADQVEAVSNLLEKDLLHYSIPIGGAGFRRVAGACLLIVLLMSLMVGSAYYWNTRRHSALGIPICSVLGLMLVLLLPWNKFLAGFALYQRYSPFFLVRHASQISVAALLAALVGIPVSYFLARTRGKA
jgi:hypothetical protein